MKKIKWLIFSTASVVLIWPLAAYYYFGFPEGGIVRDSIGMVGKRVPIINSVSNRLLILLNPLIFNVFRLIYRDQAVYFSLDEISILKQVLEQISIGQKFSSESIAGLKKIWGRINDQRLWLPESGVADHSWVEISGDLYQLKIKSQQLLTEMEKDMVSVVVTIDSVNRNVWHINFHNEVIFPVLLDDVIIISAANRVIYLGGEDQFNSRQLVKGDSPSEYKLDIEKNRDLSPIKITGELNDISDIQFMFVNTISQVKFAPRAVRFIDANDQL